MLVKIKYLDETEKEFEVKRFGYIKALQVAKKHIPINDLTLHKDGSVSLKGDVDFIGLGETCLKSIDGLDLNAISGEEANRVYKLCFEKDIMAAIGQGGNPN